MQVSRLLAASLLVMGVIGAGPGQAATIDPDRPTVFVTGSNRGIGLAFVRHYAAEGWNVLAAARDPGGADELRALTADYPHVVIEQLDVTDIGRIEALAEAYRGTPIDLLINNAGIYGDVDKQVWGALDAGVFDAVMDVNVFGPLKIAEAFADHVAASEQKKIVSITSGVSSLELGLGASNGVLYAISKAALNMAMRKAGMALADRGVIVALVTPGLVDTDMLATSRPNYPDPLPPQESVAHMARIIASLDQSYDGRPVTYEGEVLPW